MSFNEFFTKLSNKYLLHEAKGEETKNGEYIVNIENLSVSFKTKAGVMHAVRDVSMKIKPGEIIGIVGESGSGKSVTVKTLIGFNDNSINESNKVDFKEIDISRVSKNMFKYIRGSRIAYIPQDPLLSLNPTKKIGVQIIESIKISKKRKLFYKLKEIDKKYKKLTKNDSTNVDFKLQAKLEKKQIIKEYKESIKPSNVKKILFDVLNFIGIKNVKERIKDYPHEFSGGMRQRIVIAMAIVSEPDLIIADEPTTALDVTIQAKVLDLIKRLRDELNITIILISHNIGLVANFCDFIYVMYAGKIVEQGLIKEIFTNPRHPYTWALISSIPDSNSNEELQSIPGTPPNLTIPPIGDAFAPRNKYATKIDFEEQPPLFTVGTSLTHKAATWLLHPDSPMKKIPDNVLSKIKAAKESIELKEKNKLEEKKVTKLNVEKNKK